MNTQKPREDTIILKKYGSRKAWLEHMSTIGEKGGSISHPNTRPFRLNKDLARRAGKIGGEISRRHENNH